MKQLRYFVTTVFVALLAAGASNRVSVPRADGEVTNNRVAAAKSAERSYEHREPPSKHLVAVRSRKDLELGRPVAG